MGSENPLTPNTVKPPQKLNYRHEAIIDFMVANPEMKQGEIAECLGISQAWLSTIKRSDAFRREYRRRMNLHHDNLNNEVTTRLYNIANKGAKIVEDALDDPQCDPRFALDAKDKALAKLGFGSKANLNPTGPGTSPAATAEDLKAARGVLDACAGYSEIVQNAREAKVIDGELVEDEVIPDQEDDYGQDCQEAGDEVGQEVESGPVDSPDQESPVHPAPRFLRPEGKRKQENDGGDAL